MGIKILYDLQKKREAHCLWHMLSQAYKKRDYAQITWWSIICRVHFTAYDECAQAVEGLKKLFFLQRTRMHTSWRILCSLITMYRIILYCSTKKTPVWLTALKGMHDVSYYASGLKLCLDRDAQTWQLYAMPVSNIVKIQAIK